MGEMCVNFIQPVFIELLICARRYLNKTGNVILCGMSHSTFSRMVTVSRLQKGVGFPGANKFGKHWVRES